MRLLPAAIHSDDATLLWLPHEGLLFAGDTMEDTVSFATSRRTASSTSPS